MKSRLAKWQRWIKRIVDDVSVSVSDRRTWDEMRLLWRSNPALDVESEIPGWIARMHAGSVALSIRRQVDSNADSVSLQRLLSELVATPGILTRAWRVSLADQHFLRRMASDDFDKWVDPTGSHLDPRIPARDLKRLEVMAKRARAFANRRVAHASKKKLTDPPTYGELHRGVTLIEGLATKYYTLLTGGAYVDDSLLPTRQFNYETLLRRPWQPPHWQRKRWPRGRVERHAEHWPHVDGLGWGDYLRLARRRHEIRLALSEVVRYGETGESPIRGVLADLGLPSSDAAVQYVRDHLASLGSSWSDGRRRRTPT